MVQATKSVMPESLSGEVVHQFSLLCFSTSWCAPCQQMKPVVEALKKHFADRISILPVDADEYPHLTQGYKIRAVPTFVFLDKDVETARRSGAVSLPEMAKWLDLQVQEATQK
ncbi:thioredoxin family protein [Litoribrevibacter euphylliae]|uniref:Thioredoxin family protein n=1 Tax=Litoribrevibacter euphylliae TaxID=1834034 RepID=A0ABV7HGC9_9GAMM